MQPTEAGVVAFDGHQKIAAGTHASVAQTVGELLRTRPDARVLVFDRATSALVDLDPRSVPQPPLRLGAAPLRAAAATPAGPGRPRLGVVAREVTLLPRHWEWLGSQPGGASVALRKLVENAKRDSGPQEQVRRAQEVSYRFMSAIAGDLAGFEEAARALFAGDATRFSAQIASWPEDVRAHVLELAGPAWSVSGNPQENSHV